MKALLSVYDKTGIVEFSKQAATAGYELLSTGGTHASLTSGGLAVQQVADYTGSPEILEGRVKTLHPTIYAGLLAKRDSPAHMGELKNQGIDSIDLVVVNLYPFVETVSKPDVALADALENIDIGGPTMLRAASKNFLSVAVVVDPTDYHWIGEKLANGGLTVEDRRGLAAKAFHHVSTYDAAVTRYLLGEEGKVEELPDFLTISLKKVAGLRYGENPHQIGGLYSESAVPVGMAGARQIHGRELSYNNLMDADAAWRTASDFSDATVSVVKHANSCGLASRDNIAEAYLAAYAGDTVSAFGGIVAFNRTVTAAAADAMDPVFYEVVIAPDYEPKALDILKNKRNLRILAIDKQPDTPGYDLRPITGGVLVQTADTIKEDPATWTVATQRAPSDTEMKDLAFAWKAAKHIKSNAIVFAKDLALVGMGAGQPNRVVSVHLSQRASGDKAKGSVLASDAFFPFADNIELAAEAGITAVVQPGGSIRDDEVITAADKAGLAMMFTGVRHFKH